MNIDDQIHGMTTLVNTSYAFGSNQGTGFFYQQLDEKESLKEKQWCKIEKTFLITNRHVVLGRKNEKEFIPTALTFNLRRYDNEHFLWEPITLTTEDLLERARFHPNQKVDICAIYVLDLLTDKLKDGKDYLQWCAVSKDNFPGENKIHVDVTSSAVVVGYPCGFYDETNKFPTVKYGIIASRWGLPFNGNPYFLIDAKLFPGSSGSIVLSEPTNIMADSGSVFQNTEKQFAFLGVFSGEPFQQSTSIEIDDMEIIRKSGFNVGIVWYGQLIEDIIKHDQKLKL